MKYHCLECSYRWISRKSFGSPAKCPSCNSRAIEPYIQLPLPSPEWKKDPRAVASIIQDLKHNNSTVRERAARRLGELGDSRAVEPLIEVLQDNDFVIRAAAWALGELGDPRAIKPLKALIKYSSYCSLVNKKAVEALSKIKTLKTK